MSTNDNDPTDEPITATRRSVLGASATAPLAFWDDWSMFADEEQTEYDILRTLDGGTPVAEGITQLDLGDNLSVEQTAEDGVRIDAAASGGGATRLEDLEDVDVTGWLEGPIADRPASGDLPAGVRYEATDQDITYRNTSSNGWVATGGTGTAENPLPEQHVQSFSAERLVGDFPTEVRILTSSGASSIDPSTTSTPIGDALTTVSNNGGGTVILPPTTVQDPGPLNLPSNIRILGSSRASKIEITGSGNNGFVFDDSNYVILDGFELVGPGDGAAAADAFVFQNAGSTGLQVPSLRVSAWYGHAIRGDAPMFESNWGTVRWHDIDSGDVSAMFDLTAGPSNSINQWGCYPSDTTSGVTSRIIELDGALLEIGQLNLGGASGQILNHLNGFFELGRVNYERTVGTAPDWLFQIRTDRPTTIEQVQLQADATDVYKLRNAGNDNLGEVLAIGATIGGSKVNVTYDRGGDAGHVYAGLSSDVTNSTGSTLENGVACLSDLTIVT